MTTRKTANGKENSEGSRTVRCCPAFGDLDCLEHAIPGCALLLEWSKIRLNLNACVCFDMPSCCLTKRGRIEANNPLAEYEEVDACWDLPPSFAGPPCSAVGRQRGRSAPAAAVDCSRSLPQQQELTPFSARCSCGAESSPAWLADNEGALRQLLLAAAAAPAEVRWAACGR